MYTSDAPYVGFEYVACLPAERNEWFKYSGDFDEGRGAVGGGSYNKSVNACGNGLPDTLKPTCDRFLGDTPACECQGKKKVDKVTVKVGIEALHL